MMAFPLRLSVKTSGTKTNTQLIPSKNNTPSWDDGARGGGGGGGSMSLTSFKQLRIRSSNPSKAKTIRTRHSISFWGLGETSCC